MMALVTPARLLVLLACVFAMTLVVLLLVPGRLPNARSIKAQDDPWSLPMGVRVDSDLALSTINQRQLWGATVSPGQAVAVETADAKPLTPPDWRIAGVFTELGRYAVLIAVEGQFQPQTLHVGDQLPGGAKILAIGNDHLSLSLNGRRVSLSTYPQ